MVKLIKYPVKIHFPGCKCKHYHDKIPDNNQILVSPYIKCHFNNKYFKYDSYESFLKDHSMFVDNCLCTYQDGIYNGGVVVVTKINDILAINNSTELSDVKFELFDIIKDKTDNSNLINNFCKLFPELSNFYTIVGKTTKTEVENYTFPKGKISLCDQNIECCCYREFHEETGCILPQIVTNTTTQTRKREMYDLKYIPMDVIIDNFLLKIIVI